MVASDADPAAVAMLPYASKAAEDPDDDTEQGTAMPGHQGSRHGAGHNGRVALLCKISLTCLAVWACLGLLMHLAYHAGARDRATVTATQDDATNECDCGRSVSEAQSLGCAFDALASAWLPAACRDDELTAEFNRSGPGTGGTWPYWADANGTRPIGTADMALMAGTGRLWYGTRAWHVAHCNFYWRKRFRARRPGRVVVERRYDGLGHIVHCGGVALDERPLDAIAVHAGVSLNSAA